MQRVEVAKLCLKTHILHVDGRNTKGTCDRFRRVYTFNNVNLKAILGDMYDRYETFNLQLTSVTCTNNVYENGTLLEKAGLTEVDRIVDIYMSGLNFVNGTYDVQSGNNVSNACLGGFHFYTDFIRSYADCFVTFHRPSNNVNLTFEYLTTDASLEPLTLTEFPNMTFMFNIYGVPQPHKHLLIN